MKNFIRVLALVMALIMSASLFACTGSEKEDDGDGEKREKLDLDLSKMSKDDINALFEDACEAFLNADSLELLYTDVSGGETLKDTYVMKKNSDGKTVALYESEINKDGDVDISYIEGKYQYSKYHYTNEIIKYASDDELTNEFLLEIMTLYFRDGFMEEFASLDLVKEKKGEDYTFSYKFTDILAAYRIISEIEDEEELMGRMEGVTDFSFDICLTLDAYGFFKNMNAVIKMNTPDGKNDMSADCTVVKYNDKSIKLEEPDWVKDYKANNDDSDDDENDDSFSESVDPIPGPGGNGNDKPSHNENIEDDSAGTDDSTNAPGIGNEGNVSMDDAASQIESAFEKVINSESLDLYYHASSGTSENSLTLKSVKGSDGSYKINVDAGSYEMYVDSDGKLYYYEDSEVSVYDDKTYALVDILTETFYEMGFMNTSEYVKSLVLNGFKYEKSVDTVRYNFETDYVSFAYMSNPDLKENSGFQSMISTIEKSLVTVTVEIMDDHLSSVAVSCNVDLEGGSSIDTHTVLSVISIDGEVDVFEPDWIH